MANFETAYAFMAPHEWNQSRNYTDIPGDPGGATKYGITLATLRGEGSWADMDRDGDVDADDVRLLTEDHAKTIYHQKYWQFDGLKDSRVAAKIFDACVNVGPRRAIKWAQECCVELGTFCTIDGVFGPQTESAINFNSIYADRFILLMGKKMAAHYNAWCDAKPEREKFRKGLLNRAMDIP
jgi:lysozyme family protein